MNAVERLTPASTWHARLQLGFERRAAGTVLADLRHQGPLRVQKALYPEGPEVCQAIILHPPSGIAGGDHLEIGATLGEAAQAQLTTPGAGKWYRSAGADASQCIHFDVAAGATLEWLPQETIVFDGALARMDTRIRLAADSRYLGWDILCLGRAASGEKFDHGRLDLACRLERAGKPIWIERGRILGQDAMLQSPAGWDGADICGTLMASFPELDKQAATLLAACRATAPEDGARHGLTALPGLILARYLGHNSEAARLWFARLWQILRPASCGREAVMPRIWNT